MSTTLIMANGVISQLMIVDKTTWWGCGNHVPSVLDQVPVEERCSCNPKVVKDGKEYPPMATQAD